MEDRDPNAMLDESDLAAEWQALRGRDYAEEGIPVILGVETIGTMSPRAGDAGVAGEFRALTGALASVRDADPAAIIEILAARELQRLV